MCFVNIFPLVCVCVCVCVCPCVSDGKCRRFTTGSARAVKPCGIPPVDYCCIIACQLQPIKLSIIVLFVSAGAAGAVCRLNCGKRDNLGSLVCLLLLWWQGIEKLNSPSRPRNIGCARCPDDDAGVRQPSTERRHEEEGPIASFAAHRR